MLKTGTEAWAASSSTSASGPVRTPIAATWRESTSAVSRTDSPRDNWRSACLADEHDVALTSRNALLPLRRALARRWPDLMRSGGGSANAILVRGERIGVRARRRLRWWPERRVVHAVRLAPSGVWVAN